MRTLFKRLSGYFYRQLNGFTSFYKGASIKRRSLAVWRGGQSSADMEAEVSGERSELLARSADLYRNNPLASAVVNRQALNVIGDIGLLPQAQIDAKALEIDEEEAKEIARKAESEWKLFTRSCDYSRTLSMRGIQELILKRTFIDGDVFINTPFIHYPDDVYGLKLQVIESARVCNPNFSLDKAKLRAGIEYTENGVPLYYYVLNHFPYEILPEQKESRWERLPVFGKKSGLRRVCHVYLKEREGQSRGLPLVTPIIEPLKQLDRYRDAEIMAAVVAAMFTVFVRTNDPEAELMSNVPQNEVGEIEPGEAKQEYHIGDGAINYLGPNETIEIANPTRPNTAYEPFVQAVYKEIGAALSIPIEELLLHYQSSYSAARASIIQAWRLYMARRAWLADMFLNHIWRLMWEEAVVTGRIRVRGWDDPAKRIYYTQVKWVGPGKGAIDELKAVQAAALRIEKGFSTYAHETAELKGLDSDRVAETLAVEKRSRREKEIIQEENKEKKDALSK